MTSKIAVADDTDLKRHLTLTTQWVFIQNDKKSGLFWPSRTGLYKTKGFRMETVRE